MKIIFTSFCYFTWTCSNISEYGIWIVSAVMICLVYASKELSWILSAIRWIKHKVQHCTAKLRTLAVGDLLATLFGSLVWLWPFIFYYWLHRELLCKRQSSRLTATAIANTEFLLKFLHLFIQECACTQIHTLATRQFAKGIGYLLLLYVFQGLISGNHSSQQALLPAGPRGGAVMLNFVWTCASVEPALQL